MASTKRPSTTVSTTTNYRLFSISEENRPLDIQKHGRLKQMMREYGFLSSFPIVCIRDSAKKLVVKDGQHRLAIAEELGLPVHYVVSDVDFDIAAINCTAKQWAMRDYAVKYAANGIESYAEGLQFCEDFGLPLSLGFCLLAGHSTFGNLTDTFREGRFAVKDREWAHAVAGVYSELISMAPPVKGIRFAEACMAVCRVEEVDTKRLVQGAKGRHDRFVACSTRDAYLDILEDAYNFRRQSAVPLKFLAVQAMRNRNASVAAAAKAASRK